ncbi:tyrosine-type recombinase/integrase [Klebsiella variicola]|uniref:tyrosine-type DNA invertase n=1 Tax=Klebsiella variicola TaxID=244366 RepID=UPI00135FD378|nr:tyrosine-type DNA invertase [Klebsiella variicola]MUM52818.1 tyrosine-type recombinase/integrase [Klebsiella variicola]MUM58056.1 tyrosine-type recombinase/integrase [Klebsiella variicola]
MQERKYLTQSEVERILNKAKDKHQNQERDYCLIYMSFIHGFRVSEACRLRISDMDLEEGHLFIRRMKNGFDTCHPILGKELQAIRSWLKVRSTMRGAESDWLFLSRQGKPLTRQRVYQLISQLGIRAALTVHPHPHMLRHACGFALAERGIDTRLIQDYLGHRNIRHTVRYTASNAERFEGVWCEKRERKTRQLGPNCLTDYILHDRKKQH